MPGSLKSSQDGSEKKALIRKIQKELKKLFPNPKIPLRHKTHWELLVAVILSAQATDKKVNEVTKVLFKKYRTLADYAEATPTQFAKDIAQIGLFRSKARYIVESARIVRDRCKGRVPRTMEALTQLPGVGRKTANVVLGGAFGLHEGVVVDTHVARFANRFGLSKSKDPVKIEKDLMEVVPKKDWHLFPLRVILYSRQYAPARGYRKELDPMSGLGGV